MLNMMEIIKFNIISCFLCFLIVPSLFANAQESDKDAKSNTPKLVHAWFSRCFVKGFNLPDCSRLSLVSLGSDLSVVRELAKKCLDFHRFGGSLGKLNSFCSIGIKAVLNTVNVTQMNCGDIEIPGDVNNVASECCLTCKVGIQQATSGEKCRTEPNLSVLPERAQHFCCNKSSPVNLSSNVSETNLANGKLVNITNLSNDNLLKLSEGVNPTLISSPSKSGDVGLDKIPVGPYMLDLGTYSVSTVSENIITSDKTTSKSTTELLVETTTLSTTTAPNVPIETTPTPEPTSTSTAFVPPAAALVFANSIEPSNSTTLLSTWSSGSEESADHSDTLSNCLPGFELNPTKKQCVYIDYCDKDPCFQSDEDQHYCVNYFIGRECIDKVPEEYVWSKRYNLLKLKDTSKSSSDPILLDLAQSKVTLTKDDYKNFPFLHLKLPKSFKCTWEKNLDQTWPLTIGQGLKDDQLKVLLETNNEYKISIDGTVKPQAVAISIDCKIHGRNYYRHKVYLTFNPHQNDTM